MKPSTRKILKVLLECDDTITEQQRHKVIDFLLERPEPLKDLPLLLNQAQVAKLLGVSRITIYRMTKEDVLHPILLRDAVRYRREDIEEVARKGTGNDTGDIQGSQNSH